MLGTDKINKRKSLQSKAKLVSPQRDVTVARGLLS